MKLTTRWPALILAIVVTLKIIHFLFMNWIWQPTDFEFGFHSRIILSGFLVTMLIGVEIVFFRRFLTR